ncbi:MAG: DUF3021 domain-containing protein [Acutalibacteraceae bacterium]|nr:DUF3021 domain-containing protein [Acutalibacteraceae bacterium]
MKKFWLEFIKRGTLFAWAGPTIVCIVWACLKVAGVIEMLDVNTVVLGVMSSMLMAFVVAGISVIHQMEQIPKGMAALIQMSVIYIDYLAIYLINGWMPLKAVGFFTVGFLACFAIIWGIIYLTVRKSVNKLNSQIGE